MHAYDETHNDSVHACNITVQKGRCAWSHLDAIEGLVHVPRDIQVLVCLDKLPFVTI